ncbi:unnamed protein product [Macrosiphum euphorbiae]|uniref:Uncharacterized protein n=1 Tax=Macrosiphum euphorbiae TaxID=13131 RepID=A0AAV0VNC7_9HEMI|nr:unnamed protein product [Macrosiphum euphorbiae]
MELFNTSLQKLTVRDELMFCKFKMSHNRFERKLTCMSRDIIKEFEEIRRIRMNPSSKEQSSDFGSNETSMSQDLVKVDNLSEYFSIDTCITVSDSSINALKMKLHKTNIYMNKSIKTATHSY